MAAIAAVLALLVTNKPYSSTSFPTALDEKAILSQIATDLGLSIEYETGSGTGAVDWSEGWRDANLLVTTPDVEAFQKRVMPEFQNRIRDIIDNAGGTSEIILEKPSGNSKLKAFTMQYHIRGTTGRVRVISIKQEDNKFRILFFVDEW